jgi:hypothetical protein
MSTVEGGCLCGAVRFTATDVPGTFGVCHCDMCRRWTGSALLAVSVPEAQVTWRGEDRIARMQSSAWAERAWCRDCGTGLFFRMTVDSDWSGNLDLPIGIFDDPNGFTMSHEIWIDHKPDSYGFAGDGHKRLTRQECVAKFSLLDSDQR